MKVMAYAPNYRATHSSACVETTPICLDAMVYATFQYDVSLIGN